MKPDPSLLQTGWLLMAGGFLLNYLREIPLMVKEFFLRWFTIRIETPDNLSQHGWLKVFLSDLTPIGGVRDASLDWTMSGPESKFEWKLPPAPGVHYYWYKGRLIQVHRYRKELNNVSDIGKALYENLSLRFYFASHAFVRSFFDEVRAKSLEANKKHVKLMVWQGASFFPYYRRKRDLDSVCLPAYVKENLLTDIQDFIESRERYADIGVPHRRGYLLKGAPGNGKTSIIKALAGHLERSIQIVNLTAEGFDDVKLQEAFMRIDGESIVLLEDIDCLFTGRENDEAGVSFSGLLNALDGVISGEGYLLFMTTNHPEKLDPALIRPGRVDVQLEITNVVREQAIRYFNHFYGSGHEALAEKFGHRYFTDEPSQVSMAQLQNHLLLHKNNPEDAVTYFS